MTLFTYNPMRSIVQTAVMNRSRSPVGSEYEWKQSLQAMMIALVQEIAQPNVRCHEERASRDLARPPGLDEWPGDRVGLYYYYAFYSAECFH
jgi:hypothetical protein